MEAKHQVLLLIGAGMLYIFYQIVKILCGVGEASYKGEEDEKGECHGKGKFVFANGNVYVGEFHHGQLQGSGRFKNKKAGRVYYGQFKGGTPHGQGRDILKDGTVYMGEFKDGVRYGRGQVLHAGGGSYTGDWKNGERSGKGILQLPDGSRFWGSFLEDVKHGPGIFCDKNGVRTYQEWSQGKLEKTSKTRPAHFPRFLKKTKPDAKEAVASASSEAKAESKQAASSSDALD